MQFLINDFCTVLVCCHILEQISMAFQTNIVQCDGIFCNEKYEW